MGGKQVAEQRGLGLPFPTHGPDEVVRAAQRRQALSQVAVHLGRCRRRARGDGGEAGCNGEQVLDPVAHLARQQVPRLLGLLARRAVEEGAEHDPPDGTLVGAAPTSRDPLDAIRQKDAEVDLLGTRRRAGDRKRGPHSVEVRRSDPRGQVGEDQWAVSLRLAG